MKQIHMMHGLRCKSKCTSPQAATWLLFLGALPPLPLQWIKGRRLEWEPWSWVIGSKCKTQLFLGHQNNLALHHIRFQYISPWPLKKTYWKRVEYPCFPPIFGHNECPSLILSWEQTLLILEMSQMYSGLTGHSRAYTQELKLPPPLLL